MPPIAARISLNLRRVPVGDSRGRTQAFRRLGLLLQIPNHWASLAAWNRHVTAGAWSPLFRAPQQLP